MKIYTRTGDQGSTSLFGGQRVSKADLRLEAYGTLDELNCFVGWLVALLPSSTTKESWDTERAELADVQDQLFRIGSHLAMATDQEDPQAANWRAKLPALDQQFVARLEKSMDRMDADLKPLKNFVLPGGSTLASATHVCRAVARRAERNVVRLFEEADLDSHSHREIARQLNRLNDYFFVLARHFNRRAQIEEPVWKA
ncbi:MAG TPA: cob(I)yrinic acid a,c-diamide adenosyltransferase [Pseudobdellovibrionaceae bacterium]|nr:cob(I)yrinic acid a,c-diamide adenosyltransferase [Pseudobdellovibrionaceae bacterium]